MSSEIFSPMAKKRKKVVRRGDPALLDRLKRARGSYTERTGNEVGWKELAAAADLKPASMSDIVSLEKVVTIAEASAFAKRLGVSFAWLAIGEGPMLLAPSVPVDETSTEIDDGDTHETSRVQKRRAG